MDPLSELRDIHLPIDPSWWPPAPGWWVTAAALLTMVALGVSLVIRRRHRQRPLRAARRILADIESNLARDGNHAVAARRVSALVRRFLMGRFPGDRIAGLEGAAWARYIGEACPALAGRQVELAGLIEAPYRPDPGDAARLVVLAREVVNASHSGATPRKRQ